MIRCTRAISTCMQAQCSSMQALKPTYLRKVQYENPRSRNIGGLRLHSTVAFLIPMLTSIPYYLISKLPRNCPRPATEREPLSMTGIRALFDTLVG